MAFRRRTRPLWRSLIDLAAFLLVLTATLYLMQRFDMIDMGTGPVEVVDGDSLRLNGTEIRLHGIDAPEYTQQCDDANAQSYPCGKQARLALRELVRGREVHCTSVETDRYGRAISRCKATGYRSCPRHGAAGLGCLVSRHRLSARGGGSAARQTRRLARQF